MFLFHWEHGSAPDGSSPRGYEQARAVAYSLIFLTMFGPDLQPVFQHCERLVIDAERWRRSHDSAQDALTAMDGASSSPAACILGVSILVALTFSACSLLSRSSPGGRKTGR